MQEVVEPESRRQDTETCPPTRNRGMSSRPIVLHGRAVRPHKAVMEPLFASRTVLTREPWTFVSLWLRREKKERASFYWRQASEFYKASPDLPLDSSPLLLYYSFLNAAKALLSAKGIAFDEGHGVTEWSTGVASRDALRTVGVQIRNKGVLPAFSGYYHEQEPRRTHSLQELFFNMPFIHRTYCLTYERQTEMFIPLTHCGYMWDKTTKHAHFSAQLSKNFASRRTIKRLPPSLIPDPLLGSAAIRSVSTTAFSRPGRPTPQDIRNLSMLHRDLRRDLHYINGTETLWYAKALTAGPRRVARQCPTLILAAMHRISELCRYQPMALERHLSGRNNWLLSEFIEMSSSQFLDEIASELTGHQFLVPNVRPAS
jgi:hypothetical protein